MEINGNRMESYGILLNRMGINENQMEIYGIRWKSRNSNGNPQNSVEIKKPGGHPWDPVDI